MFVLSLNWLYVRWILILAALAHSGPLASLQTYSAFLAPHGRVLVIGPKPTKLLSKYYEVVSYRPPGGFSRPIAYDSLETLVSSYRPKVIATLTTLNPYEIDYTRLQSIAQKVSADIITDMSDVAGRVGTGLHVSPFPYSSVVITATQPSLRGPPGALIFFRKTMTVPRVDAVGADESWSMTSAINNSVFPRHQGGPHCHAICAIGVAMGQALKPQFKEYQLQVLSNAQALAESLSRLGYTVESSAPWQNSHLVVVKLPDDVLDAERMRDILSRVGIISRLGPDANELHFGTAAMTTRGFAAQDFQILADIIHSTIEEAKD
jgi:glycine hydroxymethyltransferase